LRDVAQQVAQQPPQNKTSPAVYMMAGVGILLLLLLIIGLAIGSE
jgi:septal ring-binding cell division protein DamX